MKIKVQREVFSWKADIIPSKNVCSPSNKYLIKSVEETESPSLCSLRKGSLTVEAAFILPFFLTILLAFFSLFLQYALAADLKIQAAAEAKKMGITMGDLLGEEITICKKGNIEKIPIVSFGRDPEVSVRAVCRAWIGFTQLETEEVYVYITPTGSVYHLFRDCTHLNLSIDKVVFAQALILKNEYGEGYRKCELCKESYGALVYITKEGNCYHSQKDCSGLKRTVQTIALSKVQGRDCCLRCMEREGL